MADIMMDAVTSLGELLERTQVVVFTAPTGCGKSTKIPKHLSELYAWTGLKVACTQPRRIAATSLAKVVSKDMDPGGKKGTVSYKIRFDDTTTEATKLVFMTDGALLNEVMREDDLAAYSAIVVDEAHERSMDTEVLLCLLKVVLRRRKTLKLVIMSATLNAKLFIDYFQRSELIEVKDIEMFPIKIFYLESPPRDIVQAAAEHIASIHLSGQEGHILVFFAGVDDIDRCASIVGNAVNSLVDQASARLYVRAFHVRKLHAKLSPEVQKEALCDEGTESYEDLDGNWRQTPIRKIVMGTNICEASITVPDCAFVIDGGTSKRMQYDYATRLETLVTGSIDRASATQRAGRTGRTCEGEVYRLYTREHFNEVMDETAPPNIVIGDPTALVLKLADFGVNSILEFDFIERPSSLSILRGVSTLGYLGAFSDVGSEDVLSIVGKKMAKLPVSPEIAVSLDSAHESGCVGLMMAHAAIAEEGSNCFRKPETPRERRKMTNANVQFADKDSDHWGLVLLFLGFRTDYIRNSDRSSGRRWCDMHYVVYAKMSAALKLFNRLELSCLKFNWAVNEPQLRKPSQTDRNNFLKAFLRGHFMQVALARTDHRRGMYTSLHDNLPVLLKGGTLEESKSGKKWLIYTTIFMQRKVLNITCCSVVEPAWLLSETGSFFVETNFRPEFVKRAVRALRDPLADGSQSPLVTAHPLPQAFHGPLFLLADGSYSPTRM